MRSQEEIKRDYENSKIGDELVEESPNIFSYKNEPLRRKLRKEYDESFPVNKKLAIYLYNELCHYFDRSNWYYEIKDLDHDWDGYMHKHYLDKANLLLSTGVSLEDIKNIVDIISRQF